MKLFLNKITYHDCHVDIRERAGFGPERQRMLLRKIRGDENISEAVILETCNRIEIYLYAKKCFDCKGYLENTIDHIHPDAGGVWSKFASQSEGVDVVKHLFDVAAGLDSQMIGENQILGQVKAAYGQSLQCRTSRIIFHRLFHNAFRVGKTVRTQTDINCGAVSVGLAAAELAKRELDPPNCRAMVMGAGENGELVAKYLVKGGIGELLIANRNIEKAQQVVNRLGKGRVIEIEKVKENLGQVDLIVGSTAADEPIVTYEMAKQNLIGREKKLLIIDIAVPRDVEPQVERIDCVRLYNIDDLNGQIDSNKEKRIREIPKARAIVDEFTDSFMQWYESLDIVPVITELTQRWVDFARGEAKRYAKDFGNGGGDKLEAFAESLVKKVLHGPISFLKNEGRSEPGSEQLESIEMIYKMFLSDSGDC